jgi:hypothetical protein
MRLSILACACLGALCLAAGASAGTPRVALFDLSTDLAPTSHNTFGDVRVFKSRSALAQRASRATLVHCTGTCTFGKGWLAFRRSPFLTGRDVASARAYRVAGLVWAVSLELKPAAKARWLAFTRHARKSAAERGVPDVLVLAVDGSVAGQPLANHVIRRGSTLKIGGMTRWHAVRTAKALG